jgi:hypothetical protein
LIAEVCSRLRRTKRNYWKLSYPYISRHIISRLKTNIPIYYM